VYVALALAMPAVRTTGYYPGGGDIISTYGDEAEEGGGVFLQVHLSLTHCCLSEDLPVCALKTAHRLHPWATQ